MAALKDETDPSRERTQPLVEVIPVQRVLLTVQLHSGVLSHQAARKLDRAGWRLDERDLTTAAAEPTAKVAKEKGPGEPPAPEVGQEGEQTEGGQAEPRGRFPQVGGASASSGPESELQRAAEESVRRNAQLDGVRLQQPSEELASRLEAFVLVAKKPVEKCVRFQEGSLQQWAATGEVDFLEIFAGGGALTMAVNRAGCRTGEGLDQDSYAYGKVRKLRVASE